MKSEKLRKRPSSACASSAALFNNGVAQRLLACLYVDRQRAQASPEEGTREEKTKETIEHALYSRKLWWARRDWKLKLEDATDKTLLYFDSIVYANIRLLVRNWTLRENNRTPCFLMNGNVVFRSKQ